MPAARRERPGWLAIAFIGICVLTAVALYVTGVRMIHRPSLRPTIAVLPFTAVNADEEAARFGASLATQLRDALRNASELRVADGAADVLVQGAVDRAGGRLRVTAWLIRSANRYQLWTHTYELDAGSAAVSPTELAQIIATSVRAELHIR